jgi:hypothetical protein
MTSRERATILEAKARFAVRIGMVGRGQVWTFTLVGFGEGWCVRCVRTHGVKAP